MTQTLMVGYIGLGIMGRPAVLNLLHAGYSVGVWARRAESLPPLTDASAVAYDSPAQLAAASDVVITNVADTPDVEEVILSEHGIRAGMASGGLVIDMSTIAPAAAVTIAAALAESGIDFLDAPVSGGEQGARDGTLTFMVGGTVAAFERALPLLNAMGKTITHVGASGAGQVAKACNQIIIAATISGVAEAFSLAKAHDTDMAKVRQALSGGFAASKVLEVHAQRMIDDHYTPGFKAALHRKDIAIALAAAAKHRLELPSAEIFKNRLDALIAAGNGALDSSAVAKLLLDDEKSDS